MEKAPKMKAKKPKKYVLGNVTLNEWNNQNDKGDFKTYSFEKFYKDPNTGEFKNSTSFTKNDLMRVYFVIGKFVQSSTHELGNDEEE